MKVVEIRSEAELQELRPAWDALLAESASNTIFLSWEWATAWWSAYGKPGELRILVAFDDRHTSQQLPPAPSPAEANAEVSTSNWPRPAPRLAVLRGIAPLRSHSMRRYGQRVPALSFIGDGSNDSDYLDFIIASGHEEQVMAAFESHLAQELSGGAVLLLNEIPDESPDLRWLKELAESQGAIHTEAEVPCGVVRLPQSWEDYLGALRPRFRTKIRSVLRNLETRPEVQFGFCEDVEEIGGLLPILFDLHTRRWAQDAKPGVFGWNQKRDFYFRLSPLLFKRGWLRFTWLKWNERILACQYGFEYQGKYFQLQEGYEPSCEHWNVGMALRAWSIRELLKRGVREYDFMGGIGRHKTDWGAETKHSKQIQIARPSYKNLLFCHGPQWEVQARESIRKIVPEKALAVRHELRLAASQRRNGHTAGSSPRKWMRSAVAEGYFRSGLPALMRPLRDRYQLSISPAGDLPKISRRSAACGRILYYHRVNDEGDAFFPAISTELFEQEMRFVARHYKVVSLAGLLDHLESGSPGTALAITFDDGYQDNYQNAFPILRRYGLPATIFLTTGGMDSCEPLWFEQLAHAVKTTAREFIDLEIDFPRRFWMRTPAERLEANDGIFALLRVLEDCERRKRLNGILPALAASGGERKNRMLTWDQIRLMKAQGIDFGGHTVTHPFLSKLTREQALWEVSECKRRIEDELQQPADYFAYPNGREEDFSSWNGELIRGAGYRAAVTTIWGMNYRSTHPMELRRGGPWEDSPALFAYKLDWYEFTNA